MRAAEINANLLIKATKVDGVYDSDPMQNPDALKYETISYDDVLQKRLNVMDATAIALCRDNQLQLQVLAIHEENSLLRAISGESVGTKITA